jgi:uncharacterized membrane protein
VNPAARAFAAVALVAGFAIAIVMPPGAAPDETRHLSRVVLMSEGDFGVPGLAPPRSTIPKSIGVLYRTVNGEAWPAPPPARSVREMAAFLRQPLEPERRVFVGNAGTYPPFVYAPHLVGVAPMRWLGLAPAAMIYAGRFASVLVWVALTALAIQVAPARQWTLALLALTPMAVAGAASISADAMTNAAALLFAACLARSAVRDGAIAPREKLELLAGALLLAFVKPGYWPLALGALAIPPVRCGGRARHLGLAAVLAAAVVVPSLAWLAFAQTNRPAAPIPGADPVGQLRFVLGDPLGFAAILARTLAEGCVGYWRTFVGELGPLLVKLPALVYVLWLPALALTLAADGPPARLSRAGRGCFAAGAALSIGAMFGMAYLGWNPVGAPIIQGVQGRYWAPALPLLAFALPAWPRTLPTAARQALLVFCVASLALAIAGIVSVYYRF